MTQLDFGNPLSAGGTAYSLCLYGEDDTLAGELLVDRAGDMCGTRRCWKPIGLNPPMGVGFSYKDRAAGADGMQTLKLKGGAAGRSLVLIKAGNNATLGQASMPTGIASRLRGATSATLQLRTGSGGCLTASLTNVLTADSDYFRAE